MIGAVATIELPFALRIAVLSCTLPEAAVTPSMPPTPSPKPARNDATAAARGGGGASASPSFEGSATAQLRLFIGRDGLGIELSETTRLECLQVTEIAVAVAGVKFPLDVSGGISRFRHKRGRLLRLALEVRAGDLATWLAPRLRGVLGPTRPLVWLKPRRDGVTVALSEAREASDSEAGTAATTAKTLAFEVAIEASGDDLRLTVHSARGSDLHAPATAVAIATVAAALGGVGEREGATFILARAATMLARTILPDAGVRAPSTDGVAWSSVAADRDVWILHASAGGIAATPSDEALRARELALLTRAGDDARLRGAYDEARALDLAALERAPRHREISRRIAEIDALAGGRAEAALAVLGEASNAAASLDGALSGELHLEAGDEIAALAAFVRAGSIEEAPALAARAFERAAALTRDDADALDWLDRAVARAPQVARIRWTRVARRLAAGRLEDALADVEHLEAQAIGARSKHLVWRRAGASWRTAGARADAAALFERALRFVPDEPESLAGLGAALVAEGRAARGVALLTRALELAEDRGMPSSAMVVELARALAERLDDRPAAIARVRTVPETEPEAPIARALEGRYRAELGDLTGASLAFARMRELAAMRVDGGTDALADAVVPFLLEAAMFERQARDDLFAAQRHLAVALRLRPKHAKALAAYRSVGEEIARPDPGVLPKRVETFSRIETPPPVAAHAAPEAFEAHEAKDTVAPPPSADEALAANDANDSLFDDAFDPSNDPALMARLEATQSQASSRAAMAASFATDDISDDDAIAAARVEDLTRRLQIDPTNDAVADELGGLLASLGRSHELLALLSARLEDATTERREELRGPTRVVLEKLEREALAGGRTGEAALYRDAVTMFGL